MRIRITALQALCTYIEYQFPGLERYEFQYEPSKKTLYIYCQNHQKRERWLRHAEAIAQLDISVSRFVLTAPHVNDIVIGNQSTPDHHSY